MNEVGEQINIEKAACREMHLPDLTQILMMNKPIFLSWGAHAFTKNKENTLFRMKVNGHHHKGHVYIFLGFLDLFDVYLTTTHGRIKKVFKELYFDQLSDVIDREIERIDEYVR